MKSEEKAIGVEQPKEVASEPQTKSKTERVAVILIRGMVKVNKKVKDTTYLLKLRKKNCCVILEKTDSNMGMLNKIKDYVTWGNVSDEMIKKLVEKKGAQKSKISGTKPVGKKGYFNLNSPKKGFGRKGIKVSFRIGGALGDRRNEINDLIERMLE